MGKSFKLIAVMRLFMCGSGALFSFLMHSLSLSSIEIRKRYLHYRSNDLSAPGERNRSMAELPSSMHGYFYVDIGRTEISSVQ